MHLGTKVQTKAQLGIEIFTVPDLAREAANREALLMRDGYKTKTMPDDGLILVGGERLETVPTDNGPLTQLRRVTYVVRAYGVQRLESCLKIHQNPNGEEKNYGC